jgi:hypothetical protein
MQKNAIILLLLILISACQTKEIFEGRPTLDQKLFLDTRTFAIDQLDRVIHGGFRFIETTQIPGKKADSSFLTLNQIDWKFYLAKLFEGNLNADTNNCYRYSLNQLEDLPNVKVTLNYEPNYDNLKVKKFSVILNPIDNEVKSVHFEFHKNSFFREEKNTITYVPGQVLQVFTSSKNIFGNKNELNRCLYFKGGSMHTLESIDIVQ